MAIDVKKWLADKTAEIGLDAHEISAAEKLLNAKAFQGDFVPLPDFHRAIDGVKTKAQARIDELEEYNFQWQDEFNSKYKPALDAVEKLREGGFNVNGVQNDGKGGVVDQRGNSLTAEQISKMIADQVEPVRSISIDYSTFVMDKGLEYATTYNKPFQASKFREFTYQNAAKYPTLDAAFDAFTADDRKAKEENDRKAWEKQTEDRIRLELMSNATFPEAGTGMGGDSSPMFIANEQRTEVSDAENRAAFAKQFALSDLSKLTL